MEEAVREQGLACEHRWFLVVVVHHYLQHLSPTSAAYVYTSDKRVEADHRLTALEH